MLLLPEMIMMTIFGSILKMDKSIFYSDYGGTLLGNTISNIIMIILVFILKKPLQKLFNYDLSTNKKIIIVSSLTLVTIAIFFYQLVVIFRLSNNIYGYLIIITTLIMILFYLLNRSKGGISTDMKTHGLSRHDVIPSRFRSSHPWQNTSG